MTVRTGEGAPNPGTPATGAARTPRMADHLNAALHSLLESDPRVFVLGEDIRDPYGGAFKITKGLSTRFSDRVLSTPLSEGTLVGAGAGLALAGEKAIVEIMFSDFVTLAFDQIVNFAAKSTTMYGRPVPVPLIVRCPTGGRRGYGPTHSQSLQKHFVGVPGLSLHELSPFHHAGELLTHLLSLGEPCVLFEDKVLYTERIFRDGVVDDLFGFDLVGGPSGWARVGVPGETRYDCTLIAPGGLTRRALAAMRTLLVEDDLLCRLLVPARLYPLDLAPILGDVTGHVCVVEDGTAGGTWGSEVAQALYPLLWSRLARPIGLVSAADSVIPTAAHLESGVLVGEDTIRLAVREALS
ncbi:alpha-ketoacid dehydrogenase subunit beta [Sphaerimonospora sp. CA-214678]|uniref:alpha-ketoacid dehydrogenase subunit beta n=1 Tax=Sphaerimonospora sp. CA-214678 TaxID=3240029 RepID=UPI003D8D9AAB